MDSESIPLATNPHNLEEESRYFDNQYSKFVKKIEAEERKNRMEDEEDDYIVPVNDACTDHQVLLLLQREIGNQDRKSIHSRFGYRNYRQLYTSIRMDEVVQLEEKSFVKVAQHNANLILFGWSYDGKYFITFNDCYKSLTIYEYSGITDVIGLQKNVENEKLSIKPFLHKKFEILIQGRMRSEVVCVLPNCYKFTDDSRFFLVTFLVSNSNIDPYSQNVNINFLRNRVVNVREQLERIGPDWGDVRVLFADFDVGVSQNAQEVLTMSESDYYIFMIFDLKRSKVTSQLVLTDVEVKVGETVSIRDRILTVVRKSSQIIDLYEINQIGRWERKKRIGATKQTSCVHEPEGDIDIPDHWTELYDHSELIPNSIQKVLAMVYKKYSNQFEFLRNCLYYKNQLEIQNCLQITDELISLTIGNKSVPNVKEKDEINIYVILNWKTEQIEYISNKMDIKGIKLLEFLNDYYVPPTWSRLNESPMTINHNQRNRRFFKQFVNRNCDNQTFLKNFYNGFVCLGGVTTNGLSPYLDANIFEDFEQNEYEFFYYLASNGAISSYHFFTGDFCQFPFPHEFISKRTKRIVFEINTNMLKTSLMWHPTDPLAIFISGSTPYIIRSKIDTDL